VKVDLRAFIHIDDLQPQVACFIASVAKGYMPLERQASLFIEVAPGMPINTMTDIALKSAQVTPGMQVVERAYGALELHAPERAQVAAAGQAILDYLKLQESDRYAPTITTTQMLTGITGWHAMFINRFRHGNFLYENETLYTLEVTPAAYAVYAANEAEKAANINVIEIIAFGAFGRLYLGGKEEEIAQASARAVEGLKAITGRPAPAAE
jgi:ethanolamine utilization microcompartment shell protein EutS